MTHIYPERVAALVGDVIASRHSEDRESLQQALAAGIAIVNDAMPALQPIMMTVGDEFQGLYASLATALQSALRLQLAFLPAIDTRIGIGWGELTLFPEAPPFGQDGPCWWRARDAIGTVKSGESSKAVPRSRRVLCRTGTDQDELLNAYLGLRDHIVTRFDATDAEIASLVVEGTSQVETARLVNLSQSSVSRRLQSHGILVLTDLEPTTVEVGP
jgi:hypothetical protein